MSEETYHQPDEINSKAVESPKLTEVVAAAQAPTNPYSIFTKPEKWIIVTIGGMAAFLRYAQFDLTSASHHFR